MAEITTELANGNTHETPVLDKPLPETGPARESQYQHLHNHDERGVHIETPDGTQIHITPPLKQAPEHESQQSLHDPYGPRSEAAPNGSSIIQARIAENAATHNANLQTDPMLQLG